MEISLVRKETTIKDRDLWNENESVLKFEVMDGAPVKG
jgi:vacuolar protein sorting-associated protein 26